MLQQESATTVKEPLGFVYSENSSHSLGNSDDSTANDNSRKTRQLAEGFEFELMIFIIYLWQNYSNFIQFNSIMDIMFVC